LRGKEGAISSVLKWFALSIASIAVLCMVAMIGAACFVTPETREKVVEAITGPYADGRSAAWHTAAGDELIHANTQHFNIAYEISRCFPAINFPYFQGNDKGWYGNIAATFKLGLQPNGEQSWGDTPQGAAEIKLTNYQRSILVLSNATSIARTQVASAAAESDTARYVLQIVIIFVGALTTILVSIKSILEKDAAHSLAIGICAVVFSAAGTALSSINAFVGPGESYTKSERALLQARQIHLDLALIVAQDKNICIEFDPDKSSDTRTKKITDLSVKLREIVGLADVGGNLPASQTSGAGGSSSGH
jgi:Protein of unknown function (DUF4231)